MRIAVVDIGTNSTRLYIADVENGRATDELARRTNVTRLGAGVDKGGRLAEDAMERVFTTLEEYKQDIDRYQANNAGAVLTSAVRDAKNGREFADAIATRYQLDCHILTGDDEARLTYLGATS